MRPYSALFLDVDNTLLDFKAAEVHSFYYTCQSHDIPADVALLQDYQRINDAYWDQLERGEMTKPDLLRRRFADLFTLREIKGVDPVAFNQEYLDNLALHTVLIEGAEETCRILSQTYPLYLATNGVSRTQRKRLAQTPLEQYFQGIVVSEDAGCEKPSPGFFQYAFAQCGITNASSALMVGDSLSADIAGGAAAGMDTCWFSPSDKLPIGSIVPTYTIHTLLDLPALLAGAAQL